MFFGETAALVRYNQVILAGNARGILTCINASDAAEGQI
jgi:hypothetical protein